MLCPRCHYDSDSKDRYCSQCGASLIDEQKLEQLKEQSRILASGTKRHQPRLVPFSSQLASFIGWTALAIGIAFLLFVIWMLPQPSEQPIISIPSTPISNAEVFINGLTSATMLRWSLLSIFAGTILIVLGDGINLLNERLPKKNN